MSVRSDFSLDLQLTCVLDVAVQPDVKAALVLARAHMPWLERVLRERVDIEEPGRGRPPDRHLA